MCCKSWFSLFSDTNFAKSHFQLTAATHAGRLVSISSHKPPEIQSVDLEALLNNDYASLDLNNFLIPTSAYGIDPLDFTNKYLRLLFIPFQKYIISIIYMVLVMTRQEMITWWFQCPMRIHHLLIIYHIWSVSH